MTEYKRLLDSSAWLEYFLFKESRISRLIHEDDCTLLSSAISLFEVKKKMLLEGKGSEKIAESMDFMKGASIMVDVSEEILEKSAEDSARLGLSLADSVIYRTALDANAEIVTFDRDFSGRKGAIVMR